MPSVKTGHGVRATQRTNALIRPIGAAADVTRLPYRAKVTFSGAVSELCRPDHYCWP
jgi:hypothetical protein